MRDCEEAGIRKINRGGCQSMCGFIPALDPPEVCPSSETNGSRVKLVVWLVALTIVYVGVPRNVDTFGLKKEVF